MKPPKLNFSVQPWGFILTRKIYFTKDLTVSKKSLSIYGKIFAGKGCNALFVQIYF